MLKQRTSFHFPQDAVEDVHFILNHSYLGTPANAIRASLKTYNSILDIYMLGWKFIVINGDKKEYYFSPYEPFAYPKSLSEKDPPSFGTEKQLLPRNFFFSEETSAILNSIKQKLFIGSNADVIRIAVSTYRTLISISAEHADIVLRDRNGNERIYIPYAPLDTTVLERDNDINSKAICEPPSNRKKTRVSTAPNP